MRGVLRFIGILVFIGLPFSLGSLYSAIVVDPAIGWGETIGYLLMIVLGFLADRALTKRIPQSLGASSGP